MKFLHVILYSGVAIRKYIMNLECVYDRQWGRATYLGSCNLPDTQMPPPPGAERTSAGAIAALLPYTRTSTAFTLAFKISDCSQQFRSSNV